MIQNRFFAALSLITLAATAAQAEFSWCKFNFGVDWQQHVHVNCSDYRPYCDPIEDNSIKLPSGIDFISAFIGWSQKGATKLAPIPKDDKEGRFLADAKALGVTPVWYTYIIAEGAKVAKGLTDCNVGGGSGTLCQKGANYIRENRSTILTQYALYASYAASTSKYGWGPNKPMIWALEPDFVQYTDGSQEGGGLSFPFAKTLLSEIIDTIKKYQPNAWISMDISPWKNQGEIINGYYPKEKIHFLNTSGGVSQPGGTIKDATTWAGVWDVAKKGMIGDDGYGTGGTLTNPNPGWSDVNNLKARINDGVIAIMEAVPGMDWGTKITPLRSQLPELKICKDAPVSKKRFKLSIALPTNGTIVTDPTMPADSLFDSATTVKLTAKALMFYKFIGWSGASTDTTSTISLVMNQAKSVAGSFTLRASVLPREVRANSVQWDRQSLKISFSETGKASFAIVALNGRVLVDLGQRNLWGAVESFQVPAAVPTGLHLLVANGEGWHSSTPVILNP